MFVRIKTCRSKRHLLLLLNIVLKMSYHITSVLINSPIKAQLFWQDDLKYVANVLVLLRPNERVIEILNNCRQYFRCLKGIKFFYISPFTSLFYVIKCHAILS